MKKTALIRHINPETRAFLEGTRARLQELESSGEAVTAVLAFVDPSNGEVAVGFIGDGLLEVLGLLEAAKYTLLEPEQPLKKRP